MANRPRKKSFMKRQNKSTHALSQANNKLTAADLPNKNPLPQLQAGCHLAPTPAILLSCSWISPDRGELEHNLITLAWAGIVNSDPPMLSVSIRKSRYSHQMVSQTRDFCVNLIDRPLVRALDYAGVVSRRDQDKFKVLGLEGCPLDGLRSDLWGVKTAPLILGCQVKQILELGSHDLFLAEIVSCKVRDDLWDASGKLHLETADLVAYAHGQYMALGEWLGFFGFSLAKDEVFKRRAAAYEDYNRRFKP